MKTHALILVSMLLLLFSCKSHRDVSRSVTNQTRGESLVTVNDSSKTHLETSLEKDLKKQEESNSYKREREYDSEGNLTKDTETYNNLKVDFDFQSRLNEISAGDFKYSGSTQSSNNSDSQLNEDIEESTDSRLIQGWEWAIVILTIVGVTVGLIGAYNNFKRRR